MSLGTLINRVIFVGKSLGLSAERSGEFHNNAVLGLVIIKKLAEGATILNV